MIISTLICKPSSSVKSVMSISFNLLVFHGVRPAGRYFPLGLLCGRASERFGASVNEEEEEGGDLATGG